jgi:hypothetical protein
MGTVTMRREAGPKNCRPLPGVVKAGEMISGPTKLAHKERLMLMASVSKVSKRVTGEAMLQLGPLEPRSHRHEPSGRHRPAPEHPEQLTPMYMLFKDHVMVVELATDQRNRRVRVLAGGNVNMMRVHPPRKSKEKKLAVATAE